MPDVQSESHQDGVMSEEQLTGQVSGLIADRGFGFISSQGVDYFFHSKGMRAGYLFVELNKDDRVTFTPTETPKGKRAVDVRPV